MIFCYFLFDYVDFFWFDYVDLFDDYHLIDDLIEDALEEGDCYGSLCW